MNSFFFTLVLKGAGGLLEDIEDLLFEAGCSDALVCSYNHTVYLEFDRTAASANIAIETAVENVTGAGLNVASIQEAGVASMAEIAKRVGLTRSAVNHYTKSTRGPGGFPEPLFGLTSGSPLYSWPAVAAWLHQQGKVDQNMMTVSQAAQKLNIGSHS